MNSRKIFNVFIWLLLAEFSLWLANLTDLILLIHISFNLFRFLIAKEGSSLVLNCYLADSKNCIFCYVARFIHFIFKQHSFSPLKRFLSLHAFNFLFHKSAYNSFSPWRFLFGWRLIKNIPLFNFRHWLFRHKAWARLIKTLMQLLLKSHFQVILIALN